MTAVRRLCLGAAAIGVAFATMTYELTLAQSLTVIYGDTVTSYSLVIGFFVLSLGLGAAYWAKAGRRPDAMTFWSIELVLSMLGALAPIAVFRSEFGGAGVVPFGMVATLSFAFAIGFFAGMEIPILVSLASDGVAERVASIVVGLDFLGTFLASLFVPLWLFSSLGLIGSALVGSILNLFVGVLVVGSSGERKSWWVWAGTAILALLTAFVLTRSVAIESYLAEGVF